MKGGKDGGERGVDRDGREIRGGSVRLIRIHYILLLNC